MNSPAASLITGRHVPHANRLTATLSSGVQRPMCNDTADISTRMTMKTEQYVAKATLMMDK